MKSQFLSWASKTILCLSIIGVTTTAGAQTAEEPAITFKTNIYENLGEANQFSLVIGSINEGQYVDIDCGFGKIEYETSIAYMDSLNQIGGTFISCQVSKEGIVKIYGDPTQIDYFNASGCYISDIQFNGCTNLSILDLTHNELKGLDLSEMNSLQAIYVSDNTFSAETPLIIGKNKPRLVLLEMNTIEHLDPNFNLSDYPALMSFDGYHNMGLKTCDPTGCPSLMRLTLDVTDVESVDVSQNPYLQILNVSNTKVTSLDVSNNPNLLELYCDHYGSYNYDYKISELDITNNPKLKYLFCAGNNLTNLDISKCPELITVSATANYLTSFDVSQNPNLYIVEINYNCLDFATLPFDPGTWNTYYYRQRELPVNKSYKVGSSIDFSSRVLREGTTTTATLYSVSEESGSASPVETTAYSYENGILTFTEIPQDSVFIAYENSAFPEAALQTEKFKIKSEADFGANNKAFSFTTAASVGDPISFGIGIAGATAEHPIEFYVCFGDQTTQTFTATSNTAPASANVNGTRNGYGAIQVFVNDGDQLTAINVKDIEMYSADVSASHALQHLTLTNAGLYTIDLQYNSRLTYLDLSGNNLSTLSLAGVNGNYGKNVLADINLSNNQLSELALNDRRAIRNLNLSHNQLSSLDLSFGDYIETLDISYNNYSEINLGYCSNLKSFKASNNALTSIILPTEGRVDYLAIDNNAFTLATLPVCDYLAEDSYVYAPQKDYEIATKGPCTDLSSQLSINGSTTTYTWKKLDGATLAEGVDYSITNGLTRFINIEAGQIYCEMHNPIFPAFTGENIFKTTPILAAGMPTNEIASFRTINVGDSVTLSLAAAVPGTAIYFDWSGNDNVTQYVLGDTYRLFNAITEGDKEVKVYTYEATEDITVFSMSGAKLANFDGSKLTKAINVSISYAGLSEIILPESTVFQELDIEGNNFTDFDFGKYPSLRSISASNNNLTSLDLTRNPNVELVSASYNALSEIKLLDNDKLWALYLNDNQFSQIDLAEAPNISQLSLSNNRLESINVNVLPNLIVLALNNNKLNFATLPVHKPSYVVYYYHNQDNIDVTPTDDGVIDLSSQIKVANTPTVYRWFLGVPYVNDLGELEGEELIIDYEYTLENGVTKFLRNFEGVMCVMTNAALPNVYICTDLLDVTSGLEYVFSDNATIVSVKGENIIVNSSQENATVTLFAMNGTTVDSTIITGGYATFTNLARGIYIVTLGKESYKIVVK